MKKIKVESHSMLFVESTATVRVNTKLECSDEQCHKLSGKCQIE